LADLLEPVERALVAYIQGDVVASPMLLFDLPGGEAHVKAAVLKGAPLWSLKAIASVPANSERGLPAAHTTLTLFDVPTGNPAALIVDHGESVDRAAHGCGGGAWPPACWRRPRRRSSWPERGFRHPCSPRRSPWCGRSRACSSGDVARLRQSGRRRICARRFPMWRSASRTLAARGRRGPVDRHRHDEQRALAVRRMAARRATRDGHRGRRRRQARARRDGVGTRRSPLRRLARAEPAGRRDRRRGRSRNAGSESNHR
jgi:hypothetical protein